MHPFIMICDLKDPDDPQGRSYREVNAATTHAIPVGALVELDNGARAFVVKHTRDCDQTPLYSLAINPNDCEFAMDHGYNKGSIRQIR